MKRHSSFVFAAIAFFMAQITKAQVYSPIPSTGYTLDAVAENTTAVANTAGAIDGSNYVMYSAAYGALMGSTYGLPNSGLLTSGTRTYQLQPYTGPNVLFQTINTVDSLVLVTPAAYAGLSICGFATEGAGVMNVTVRFTDNTTAVYSNIALPDWFSASPNLLIGGFDRCNRTSGTPALTAGSAGNPKMVYVDFPINCTNRSKLVKNIKFQNSSTNARTVIMGLSGAAMPVFTPTASPVTCANGTDGSATISVSGGVPPFNYTVATNPVQTNSVAGNLAVGVYSYTAQDAGLCPVSGTFAVTQSLVAQPSLAVMASATNVCIGSTVAVGAIGAISYTWSNNSNLQQFVDNPAVNTTYTVGGYTQYNCYRTGSITVNVHTLPVVSLSGLPPAVCINSPSVQLTSLPPGGTLSGQGLVGSVFSPSAAGTGTQTLSYVYADAFNCSSSASITVVVNAIPAVSLASLSTQCLNSPTLALSGTPAGGVYSGNGVNGSVFSPTLAGVGSTSVTYTYTDVNSCSNAATTTVMVEGLPAVTFTMSKIAFCPKDPFVILGGTPNGGSYAGSGLLGSIFTPSAAGAGTHTITYTYSDLTTGCSDAKAVTVTVSTCAGLDDLTETAGRLLIYPNPSQLSFFLRSNEKIDLNLTNSLGQVIRSIKLDSENNYTQEMKDLEAGVYFVVSTNNKTFKQKVLVVK